MLEHRAAILARRSEAGGEVRPEGVSREGQVLRRRLRLPRRAVLRRGQRVLPHLGVLQGILQVSHDRPVRAHEQTLRWPVRLLLRDYFEMEKLNELIGSSSM